MRQKQFGVQLADRAGLVGVCLVGAVTACAVPTSPGHTQHKAGSKTDQHEAGTEAEVLAGEAALAYLAELGRIEACEGESKGDPCMSSMAHLNGYDRRRLASAFLTALAIETDLLVDAHRGLAPLDAEATETANEADPHQALLDLADAIPGEEQLRALPNLFAKREAMYIGPNPYPDTAPTGIQTVAYTPEDGVLAKAHHEAVRFAGRDGEVRMEIVVGVITLVVEDWVSTYTAPDWIQIARGPGGVARGLQVLFPTKTQLKQKLAETKRKFGGNPSTLTRTEKGTRGQTVVRPYDFRLIK